MELELGLDMISGEIFADDDGKFGEGYLMGAKNLSGALNKVPFCVHYSPLL
jgi:hypothetical protein